eukprot:scaffold2363_cov159-Pinguiococcus_pyrenoidosus.AAC.4
MSLAACPAHPWGVVRSGWMPLLGKEICDLVVRCFSSIILGRQHPHRNTQITSPCSPFSLECTAAGVNAPSTPFRCGGAPQAGELTTLEEYGILYSSIRASRTAAQAVDGLEQVANYSADLGIEPINTHDFGHAANQSAQRSARGASGGIRLRKVQQRGRVTDR